jgi:integration host factor subunit alpha
VSVTTTLKTVLRLKKGDMEKKKCLTKAELADTLYAADLGFDKQKSVEVIEDYIELIKIGLEEDRKVMLSGFGSYEVHEKRPRRGINPQTRNPLMLRARRVVKFKPSQLLRKAINDGIDPEMGSEDSSSE